MLLMLAQLGVLGGSTVVQQDQTWCLVCRNSQQWWSYSGVCISSLGFHACTCIPGILVCWCMYVSGGTFIPHTRTCMDA
jgi:hypothetical protein